MTRSKKAEATDAEAVDQEQVTCPRCAGNKRVMDFRSGDRTTGEPAGWKAIPCPGCVGAGIVTVETAAAILSKMEKDRST